MTNVPVQTAAQGVTSTDWVGYKHFKESGTFTLKKITHSDVLMSGGGLKDNMDKSISTDGAIYVYYQGTDITHPKVICISTGPPENDNNNTWYVAGANESGWVLKPDGINNKKNPAEVTAGDLGKANALEISINPGPNYIIKLDKRPVNDTSSIKYITKDREITVEKTVGSNKHESKVPEGYMMYKHNFTQISETIIYKHNGNQLTFNPNPPTQGVKAVYVYYEKTHDTKHEFPLIVCVSTGKSPWKYYKRGNEWKEDNDLQNINPENPNNPSNTGLTTLTKKLGEVKDKFEVKLEKTNGQTYKSNPNNDTITVSEVSGGGAGYKGFRHHKQGGTFKVNRITIYGQTIEGIKELAGGGHITGKQYVYVYFETDDANSNREKPLLICLSQDGQQAASPTNRWYKRNPGLTWQEETDGYDQIAPGTIDENLKGKLEGIGTELNPASGNPDTGYLNFASYFNST